MTPLRTPRHLCAAFLYVLFLSGTGSVVAATASNAVINWNVIALTAARTDFKQQNPCYASRNLAMMHIAIYDALCAIDNNYQPYTYFGAFQPNASREAAVAQASATLLAWFFPTQSPTFAAERDNALAAIPDGLGKQQGIALGEASAQWMILERTHDGVLQNANYVQQNGAGQWRPTPPDFTQPSTPQWGAVRLFVLPYIWQFRPPYPPGLGTPDYAASLADVRAFGDIASTLRTAEQEEIGDFWAYDRPGLGSPVTLYNQIVQNIATARPQPLIETARLFALANTTMADACIICWEAKYRYNLWRPITAVREADSDTNPLTTGDPAWQPLGAPGDGLYPDYTPPFPSYPSGHSTFGGCLFRGLALYYGSDATSTTLTSEEVPGVERHYTSFSQMAAENGRSRIYLGVHYSFDDQQGQALGRNVANYIFTHAFGLRKNEAHAWALYE